jgi:hypothetical protein
MREAKLVVFLIFTVLNLSAQQYKLDTLIKNGPIEDRINYVVLGDGYLNSQLNDFEKDASRIISDLFSTPPYANYREYFNVFTVAVASNVEGAAKTPESPIDNFYGSTFNYAGIERLLVPQKTNKVAEVLAATLPNYDQVIMIVNSTTYGGSGGWIATSSVNSAASEIMIHELGHSFAQLTDEYWAGDQYAREGHNMTQEKTDGKVKWRNWMGDRGIAIIPHKESPTWHKPHDRCKMQFLGNPFCAVCEEAFINVIHNLVAPIEDYSPVNSNIEADKPVTFDLTLILPSPNTLEVAWLLDGKLINGKDFKITLSSNELKGGSHALEAKIIDATRANRKDQIYVNRVVWNINASAKGVLTKTVEDREKVVTGIPNSEVRYLSRVYPNPVSDHFNITYKVKSSESVSITLMDMNGKSVGEWQMKQQPGDYEQSIWLTEIPNGMYLVIVEIGGKREVHKVLK